MKTQESLFKILQDFIDLGYKWKYKLNDISEDWRNRLKWAKDVFRYSIEVSEDDNSATVFLDSGSDLLQETLENAFGKHLGLECKIIKRRHALDGDTATLSIKRKGGKK